MELTHPEILKAERLGSRAEIGSIVVHCERCSEKINTLYDSYCQDKQGNVFCCETCAMEHYGIKLVEV